MILHLSEITKGGRKDVVLDYTLNLKYSNYLLCLFIYFFFNFKTRMFVDPSSSVTVCNKGMNNEVETAKL